MPVTNDERKDENWLEEGASSPEGLQSHRRKLYVSHIDRAKVQIYATGNKQSIDNFNIIH